MSLTSFTLIGSLLLIFFPSGGKGACPALYNSIGGGCYKINNGSNMTWSHAREYCRNDSTLLLNSTTVPNSTIHLLALEFLTEKTALYYWLKAFAIQNDFWLDGMVSTSVWNWSNNSISWFFDANERAVVGNGSNYKIKYNQNLSTYQIADDDGNKELQYICEYQEPCGNVSVKCENYAACYVDLIEQVCLCAPGYTGQYCETEIDECLMSPCLHDGVCNNTVNNYTCDCSSTFYTGRNCEILLPDPTENERSAAFWAVLGVVTGLVVLLTISDLPWTDILATLGCSCRYLSCWASQGHEDTAYDKTYHTSDSAINDYNSGGKHMSTLDGTQGSTGTNYHVMNTVWNPEQLRNQTPVKAHYDGYRSPDPTTTPDNALIQSFAADLVANQKAQQLAEKRVYAVNINDQSNISSKPNNPTETMVSWTQQLQEQLRKKNPRETSASSTKQLVHASNTDDS